MGMSMQRYLPRAALLLAVCAASVASASSSVENMSRRCVGISVYW